MSSFKPWLAVVVIVCAFIATAPSQASVIIAGTRLIYPQSEREITVRLTNDGKLPALVQAWIDDGDEKADPATIKVPFMLTPPMFRIDPTKGQSIRIIYTQEPLPPDRELVFWLNVLEVQARPKTADTNGVQIAFRLRIKLFFRPTGLAGRPEEAPAKLVWSVSSGPAGDKILRVANPTPFHVSFNEADVTIGSVTYMNEGGGMVNPGASLELAVKPEKIPAPASGTPGNVPPVHYSWINDYGASISAQAPLGNGT